MGAAGRALACLAVVAVGHAVVALAAATFYTWAWTAPGAVLFASAAAWLVAYAVAITPEQRRDTRASAYPFRSGVAVVQVTVVAPSAGLAAPPRVGPTGGLPDVVPGQVVEQDDREETGRGDDGERQG